MAGSGIAPNDLSVRITDQIINQALVQERNNEVEPYRRRTKHSSLLRHDESSPGRQGVEAEEDLAT